MTRSSTFSSELLRIKNNKESIQTECLKKRSRPEKAQEVTSLCRRGNILRNESTYLNKVSHLVSGSMKFKN